MEAVQASCQRTSIFDMIFGARKSRHGVYPLLHAAYSTVVCLYCNRTGFQIHRQYDAESHATPPATPTENQWQNCFLPST
ncbi:hypothetical protein VTN02DRAFT_4751 [Thermoascus thermophilus]